MATYTSTNGVKLISTGDEAGTWGDSTNVNLQILDRAANGFASIALTGTSYTLPVAAQTSAAQDGHYKAIKFTGTPGGACTVTLEQNDRARMYMLVNSTNQTVIITQGSGANVTIAAGDSATVLADGAGSGAAVEAFSNAISMPVATIAVTVANPGSGNKYYIDGSLQQTVELKPSVTYRFDQSDGTNATHPLAFSTNDNNSPSSPFTTGVTTVGTPGSAGAYTQIRLEQDAPTLLYYYCTNHTGMGGKAVVRVGDNSQFSQNPVSATDPSATGDNAIAIGSHAVADGEQGVAIGKSKATGQRSLAININNNAAFGAAGDDSIAIGIQASAASDKSIAIGNTASSSNAEAIAIGDTATASGAKSVALGVFAKADTSYGMALGNYSRARRVGQQAFASGRFANQGDAQTGTYVLRGLTVNSTSTVVLTTDGGAASGSNQVVLETGAAMAFKVLIMGRQDSGGTDSYMYEYTGYVRNDSGTITVGSQLGYNAYSSSLTITLAADNTNNALGISVVGRNATNIRWVATVFTSEVSWS